MTETDKQSDIEEIIHRLRGGKGISSETPLAKGEYSPPREIPVQDKVKEPQRNESIPDRTQEIVALQKQIAAYQQKESTWAAKKEQLRKEQNVQVQGEKESYASHFKLLEEKLLTLAGEKESVLQEIAQLKSLLAEAQKKLEEKETLLQETEKRRVEGHEKAEKTTQNLSELTKEKDRLAQKEESLLTQVSLLTNALSEEKNHKEIISLSVKSNQDHITELRAELTSLHGVLQEKEGKYLVLQQEKEKADARVREVEEHLVLKLASITELEEELTSTGARVEELEAKKNEQDAAIASLSEANTAHETTLSLLNEELDDYKGRITRANDTISELKRRIESLERIKIMMEEASTHVHALTDMFGPAPQSLPSLRNLVESFVVKKPARRFSQGGEEANGQQLLF